MKILTEEGWVSSELLGTATQAAELEGSSASYEAGEGGLEFELSSLANGIKENIEIAGPSRPTTFRFALRASPGVAPELLKDGSIDFRDETGGTVASLPAPVVSDSAPGSIPANAAHFELAGSQGGDWLLTVEVDRDWLSQPERMWPVYLDPTTTTIAAALDCRLEGKATSGSHVPCSNEGGQELTTSYMPKSKASEDKSSHGLLRFSLSSIPSGATINSATLSLHSGETALNTSGVQIDRVTKAWNSNVTWKSNGFTDWTTPGGDSAGELSKVLTAERGSGAGWWNFPLAVNPVQESLVNPEGLSVLSRLIDEKSRVCSPSCLQRIVKFDSSAVPNAENRPYLSISYDPAAPPSSELNLPQDGTVTARRLRVQAKWKEAGVTGVTFQYRAGKEGVFNSIPLSEITNAQGKSPAKWPLAVSGVFETEPYYLDTAKLPAPLPSGGAIQLRALFAGSPGVSGHSAPVNATIDPKTGGAHDATAAIGPGSIDLVNGKFTVSRTDVSISAIGSGLEFSRTASSLGAGLSEDTSVLGRGWAPTVPVEEAGGSAWRSVKTIQVSVLEESEEIVDYAILTDLEGYEYAFELDSETGLYVTPPEAAGSSLQRQDASHLILSDPGGNRTTFESTGGGSEYLPVSVSMPGGSTNQTRVLYKLLAGNKRRLELVIAPSAPGDSCTEANAKTEVGCRSLYFTYEPAAKWGAPEAYGDRLASITYYGPSGPNSMGSWEVAKYKYDNSGRLIEEWDGRISPALKETYSYEGSNESGEAGGRLKTLTPPGQEPWTMNYASGGPASTMRLASIKRASLLASPTVAQTSVAYEVPISGGSAPYDMSLAAIEKWGQKDPPVDATAIFPPDEIPASPPSSYARASVYYMDSEGRLSNTATPSGGGTSAPSITTSEADEFGNVVRELSAQNRLRALAAENTVAKAEELETKRHFSADGTELQEEWGPLHQVRLENGEIVDAKLHTTIEYDKGWPGTGVKPHLPTRQTTAASIPGEGEDADQRVSETSYDWTLRQPTETVVDPGKGHLELRSRIAYNKETGMLVERSLPGNPAGGDAHTTKVIYYTAGGQGNEDPTCKVDTEKKPAYAGLPCKVLSGGQPNTAGLPELLVTRYASYNGLSQPTEVVESPGGKEAAEGTRKTITTYDTAGRATSSKQVGGGTALAPSATVYSTNTGLPVEQKFTCETGCEGFDNQAVVMAYDELGRPVKYTDADGSTSETTYDLLSRPATIYDGKGTQAFGYDSTSGLLTKLEDSAAGTFTAAYDADGNMVERGLPNGLVAETTYDETGAPTALSYTKVTSCTEKCTWLEESNERSIYGQILSQTSLSSTQQYDYDKAGRLTLTKDTPQGGGCTTRQYFFDADSNRTKLTTRAPGIGGACDTSSEGTSQAYAYDAADRLTGEGMTYDSFGRITSLPAKYAGGSALATTFYSNEMVASQSQGGLTNSYQLDSAGRPRQVVQTGSKTGTEVFHYAMASDSTAWTERGGSWTRSISGIGGGLAAVQESSGTTSLQLTNLHGDIVATASLIPTAKEPTASFKFDEFGNPKEGSAGRYGWLGGPKRRTELPSGVVQMGVRSYVPTLGRFISVDPVAGGSANAYDYANADPVNSFDFNGTKAKISLSRATSARATRSMARVGTAVAVSGGSALSLKMSKVKRVIGHLKSFLSDKLKIAWGGPCIPEEELGVKLKVISAVFGATCLPKVLYPVHSAQQAIAAKTAGFAWCALINAFSAYGTMISLAWAEATSFSTCGDETPWAYVLVPGTAGY